MVAIVGSYAFRPFTLVSAATCASPISINCLMASARVGGSACLRRHSFTASSWRSSSRTATRLVILRFRLGMHGGLASPCFDVGSIVILGYSETSSQPCWGFAMSVAQKVHALLTSLSPTDIQALPPFERRRLADLCRHVAGLAD